MEIQWRRIELTQVAPKKYKMSLQSETHKGEAEFEIEEDANWIDVAKSLREEYGCDVVVNMPEGSDPKKVHFCFGKKPWKEPVDATL